jgi:hypothetical protein
MDVTALALFAPTKKVLDVWRYLVSGDQVQWREALTVVGSFAVGTGLVFLVGASSFAADLGIADLTVVDSVLAGVTLGGLAGVGADLADPTGVTIR